MKKFFAGQTQGIYATAVKASDCNGKLIQEMVADALATGKSYAITSNEKAKKEELAATLQEMFMAAVNTAVEITMDEDRVAELIDMKDNGKLAKEVYEYIVDTAEARLAEEVAQENLAPVPQVVIAEGVGLSNEQVLKMMAISGLTIGGSCKTHAGNGTILGFKVEKSGTLVVVDLAGRHMTYLATAVQGVKSQTKQEESVELKTQVGVALELDLSAVAQVNTAIEGGEQAPWEMTAEEREEARNAKLDADLAAFASATEANKARSAEVANSPAAKALQGILGTSVKDVPAPKDTAASVAVSKGAPAVAPAAKVNKGTTAPQNKNQNNGGNVQVANNTQGRQGSVATGAFGGQAVGSGRQASGAGLQLSGNFAQGAAMEGWAGVQDMLGEIELSEFMGRNTNGLDFVWYVAESAKYEGQLLTLADMKANGFKNEALGITAMQFYTPAAVSAARGGRDPHEQDFLYVEVFFGATSYEFLFRKSEFADRVTGVMKPYIYSTNITRKQATSGTWYCEYQSGRRTDKLQVVVQQDGVVRLARTVRNAQGKYEVHADDAAFVQEVGGSNWTTSPVNYGIKIGQAPFIQLMLMMDELTGLAARRANK
jgi:hypothetical protein